MKLKDKFSCIVCKILGILTILLAFVFPFLPSIYDFLGMNANHIQYSTGTIIGGIFIFLIIMYIGVYELLKTNDPIRRWNIFTINKRFKGTMDKSMDEDASQLSKLDPPTKDELIQRNRNRKINKILN